MTPRLLAFELLQRLEKNDQFSNLILDRALRDSDMSGADKALATLLLYGVTERRLTLDYQIEVLSSRPLSSLDLPTLTALRMGLYQLAFTDKIPAHAAINESVELCPRRSRGFVNAVLRSFTRSEGLTYPHRDADRAKYLSVRYSVCLPLAEKFISAFGYDGAEALLSGFEAPPPTALSVNTLKITREELCQRIQGAKTTSISPTGLHAHGSVRDMWGFEAGMFFVQDEASQICVEALAARRGDILLDICACPGSKSFGAAIAMENEGSITAFDLHEKKLPLISSGAERLGIDIISTAVRDGRNFLPELEERADRVLCDVPCSGFGVLAKKPELRYKDPAASNALPDIQLAILENACRYVRKGGTLVYSTCTVLPEENQENIFRFLKHHPEFTLTPFTVGSLDAKEGYITLLPHIHKTDGFFIAKLTKKENI